MICQVCKQEQLQILNDHGQQLVLHCILLTKQEIFFHIYHFVTKSMTTYLHKHVFVSVLPTEHLKHHLH